MKKQVVFITFCVLYSCFLINAQEEGLTFYITDKNDRISEVHDLKFFGERTYLDVFKGQARLRIDLSEISSIERQDPNKYIWKITFVSGESDIFTGLQSGSDKFLSGKEIIANRSANYGISGENLKSISRVSGISNDDKQSGHVESDKIVLKNGDTVSGKIITNQFSVKTSYASLSFNLDQIASISLEGGGQNIESLSLRTGDKLSGSIGPDTITILLSTGQETSIEKEKIKSITFRKSL